MTSSLDRLGQGKSSEVASSPGQTPKAADGFMSPKGFIHWNQFRNIRTGAWERKVEKPLRLVELWVANPPQRFAA